MKKMLVSLGLVVAFSGVAMALTCDANYHVQCTGGSGRGGGYHSSCSCAPDMCNFGMQWVVVGGTIYSYSQTSAVVPDDCSNYLVASTCVSAGVLDPLPQNPVCSNASSYDE